LSLFYFQLSLVQQISTSENTISMRGSYNDRNDGTGEKKIIGVMQLAFAYLFEQIKLRKNRSVFYIIHVSFLEVYNEQVYNILLFNINILLN
jgi:hypothetical protein